MAASRVFASRLATQMATKAVRPAIRAPVAAASKRTITGKQIFSDPQTGAQSSSLSGQWAPKSIPMASDQFAHLDSL